MKTLLVALLFSIPAFGALTLDGTGKIVCHFSNHTTIDSCELIGYMSSDDSAELDPTRCKDPYTLLAAEQTDMDAILVNAVANTKTVHSIP